MNSDVAPSPTTSRNRSLLIAIVLVAALLVVSTAIFLVLWLRPHNQPAVETNSGAGLQTSPNAEGKPQIAQVDSSQYELQELHAAYATKTPVKGWEKDFGETVQNFEIRGNLLLVSTDTQYEVYEYHPQSGPGKKLFSHRADEELCYLWSDGLGCSDGHFGTDGSEQSWNEYLNVSWDAQTSSPAWEGEHVKLLLSKGEDAYFTQPNGWGWAFFRTQNNRPVSEAYLDEPIDYLNEFYLIDANQDSVLYQIDLPQGSSYRYLKMHPYGEFDGEATPVLFQTSPEIINNAWLLKDGLMVSEIDSQTLQLYSTTGKLVETLQVPDGVRLEVSYMGQPTRDVVRQAIDEVNESACKAINVVSITSTGHVLSIDNGAVLKAILTPQDSGCKSLPGFDTPGNWGAVTGHKQLLFGAGYYLSVPLRQPVIAKPDELRTAEYFEYGIGGQLYSVHRGHVTQWLPVV